MTSSAPGALFLGLVFSASSISLDSSDGSETYLYDGVNSFFLFPLLG